MTEFSLAHFRDGANTGSSLWRQDLYWGHLSDRARFRQTAPLLDHYSASSRRGIDLKSPICNRFRAIASKLVKGGFKMSLSNLRIMIATVAWGLVVFATLSVANLPGDWGHGVCGPWGCGPPIQALLACHLSWFAFLLPLVVLPRYWLSVPQLRILGMTIVACGVVGIAGVVTYEFYNWWPAATEMHRRYIWQRLGFAVVTHIDLPLLELVVTGTLLALQAWLASIHNRHLGGSGQ